MEKILSQDEVNALLRGVESGTVETKSDTDDATGTRIYDLTSQDRIVRGRMPTLEIINERFSRLHQVALSSVLRKVVDIHPATIDTMKFGEFIKNIPLPSCINIFKMEPLRGHALLIIDARVVYLLVDHFFGGGAQTHVKIEGRDFTPIERRVIHKIVLAAFEDLQKAWTPVHPVTLQYQRTEINPQFASIVTPTEIVVLVTFELEVDGVTGKLYFCFPYSMLEPVRDKLSAGYQSDRDEVDQRWTQRFKDGLVSCPLQVTVELGKGIIKVRDLMNLATGDVLLLEKRTEEALDILIEGKLKFRGHPGVSKGNVALQVTSVIQDEGEERDGTRRTRRDGSAVGGTADGGGGREDQARGRRKAGGIHAA